MEISVRPAKQSDLSQYTGLHQRVYQDAYTNEAIGLTKERFSKEVFDTPDTQRYLRTNLEVNDRQRCWLAFFGPQLVGSITVVEREDDYELRGFYVATEHQGKGIGKQLWERALDFAKNKDITLDIYTHNTKTIEMYKKWGFVIDTKRGEFYRHWPEWPEDVKAKSIYMRYKSSGK